MKNDLANWNTVAWAGIGIPAALAWAAALLCWLLQPRLGFDTSPLIWAMWAALGWYGLLIVVFGGWWGLLLILSAT